MHILVSGAAGFIGSHLCARLVQEGHKVTGLDNLVTGRAENLSDLPAKYFTFIKQDVCKPLELKAKFDAVMHLASPASPVDFGRFALEILLTNSQGTHNLLELARHNQAVFFLASTSEVYGDPLQHPQKETYRGNVSLTGKRAVYDEGKRYAECLALTYHRVYNLPVRIARIFNTYGPRMRKDDGRVVPALIHQALQGQPLTLYGDGTQTRSFCFISDLIQGMMKLLHSDYNAPVNLGNPREYSILEFSRLLLQLTRSSAPVVFLPLPEDDPKRRKPDISLARKLLHWKPVVTLKDGLKQTLEWYSRSLNSESAASSEVKRTRARA